MFNEGDASLYTEDVVFIHGDNKHEIRNDNKTSYGMFHIVSQVFGPSTGILPFPTIHPDSPLTMYTVLYSYDLFQPFHFHCAFGHL